MHVDSGARTGFFVGMLTQVIWGLLPFYTELFPGTPVAHVLVCRVLACAATMAVLVFLFKQHKDVFALFREPKRLAAYTLAALFLGVNWTTFFWAVEHGYVLELSFATYLLPLVSIAMGVIYGGYRTIEMSATNSTTPRCLRGREPEMRGVGVMARAWR